MTPEDEEFNRIEREADMRWKAVKAALKGHREHMAQYMTEYERGVIDGRQMQVKSSVDKAVNAMTQRNMNWLPPHKCGLHLSHNEHRDVYESIHDFYDADDFISPEEWHEAVAKDSVWVLHWYPETPIGFIRIAASTLEALEAKLREKST
jgi:hypothetical protein